VVKPLEDRVVVKPSTEEERTKGGIVLPDTAKERPQVVDDPAAGPGTRLYRGERAPMHVKPGYMFFFAMYGGTEIKIDGEEYMILRQSDILAIK
jgi:chaperonin GroES